MKYLIVGGERAETNVSVFNEYRRQKGSRDALAFPRKEKAMAVGILAFKPFLGGSTLDAVEIAGLPILCAPTPDASLGSPSSPHFICTFPRFFMEK